MLVAEEFQLLLHPLLLIVGGRIFLAAFVSITEQKRPKTSATPSVTVYGPLNILLYVMIFEWFDLLYLNVQNSFINNNIGIFYI